jgi:myo-inositol-1(or 4)-monophosphatase
MEPTVQIALSAAQEAGTLIRRASDRLERIKVNHKSGNDFVTDVDRAAERVIIEHLKKAYPDHSIEGEESGFIEGQGSGKQHHWIIDPLDGTTNFIHGIPQVAVSIACKVNNRLEHAVVYNPFTDEAFSASRGRGAQLNNRRIRVSERRNMNEYLVGTGLPFRGDQLEHMDAYVSMLKGIAEGTAGIRRCGSAALDLAWVASGRFDGFWEIGLKSWDCAAGALLVKEAGGLVSDLDGGDGWLETGNLVCGNPKCFKFLLQNIRPHWLNRAKGGQQD